MKIDVSGKIVGTGNLEINNLMKINEKLSETTWKSTSTSDWKCRYGHPLLENEEFLVRLEAKRRKKNQIKGKGKDYDVLIGESVFGYSRTIFLTGIEKLKYNLKIVDSKYKYITTILTLDKSATTTRNVFEFYLKNERQLGKKIKKVLTDGGIEFYEDFLNSLEENGIQKERGADYEHSSPPDAENANRIINNYGRTNLLYSKLPLQVHMCIIELDLLVQLKSYSIEKSELIIFSLLAAYITLLFQQKSEHSNSSL